MNNVKQFETMATIRAYAQELVNETTDDQRPSTAQRYVKTIARMLELAKSLDTQS